MPLPTIEATLKTLYELARDSLKKEESIFLNINIFLDTLRIEVNKEPNIINPDLEIIVILTCLARLARRLVDEGCNLANEIAHLPVDHKGMISRRNYKQFVGTTLRAYAAIKQTEKIVQILSANRFYPENYRDVVSNVSSVIQYEKSLQDYSFYELVGHYPKIHVNQDELLHQFIRTLNDVSVGNDPVLYKCKPLLMSFLSDLKKQYYFSRIDKIKLFVDIIQLLENPYKLNQGKRNVCGPAAILMLYLKNDPESCLLSFFELLETGISKRSIPLSAS